MKKLLLTALGCICACSAYAGSCENIKLETRGTQHFTDDEFLYESPLNEMYEMGYECDNEFCDNGTTITMWPGHIFKGKRVNKTVTYKCKLGMLNDGWEAVSEDNSGDMVSTRWCDANTPEGKTTNFYDIDGYTDGTGAYVDATYIPTVLKGQLGSVENADQVDGVRAVCTKDGWALDRVVSCRLPYFACGGRCRYYTELIPEVQKNEVYADHFKRDLQLYFQNDESSLEAFLSGTLNDENLNGIVHEMGPFWWFCKDQDKLLDNGK